jgi:chemotaxis protein histidine kinase CheA/CheY-like chemotaxis protein
MKNPPISSKAGPMPGADGDRLSRLRDRLRDVVPDQPAGLAALRADVEAERAGAVAIGRRTLARALERLALMTEVWDCLASEAPESAREAASFCIRVLDRLADSEGIDPGADELSWIFEESSARWSDYLALIDPGGDGSGDRDDPPPAEAETEPPTPAIDAATLLRLLTGGNEGRTASPGPPTPQPDPPPQAGRRAEDPPVVRSPPARRQEEKSAVVEPEKTPVSMPTPARRGEERSTLAQPAARPPQPPPMAEPEIDPEYREAFLAEAGDLFERIESLVLSLGRGPGQESALTELGRCFHTLKGAAGSVGLLAFASRIHLLEERLEDRTGPINAGLIDQLHRAVGDLEGVLSGLQQGSATHSDRDERGDAGFEHAGAPTARPAVESSPAATVHEAKPVGGEAPPSAEPSDAPVRVSSARVDELMDLASELIMRRGLWTAQVEKLKTFATEIRAGRNELLVRLDRLNELGFLRGPHPSGRSMGPGSGRAGEAVGPSNDLATVVLRLVEQAEDLVVLTEAAQAHALPLTDDSDSLARLTLQLWETLQSIRIIPVRGLFQRLARVAHEAARVEGRAVEIVMIGEETGLDRAVQDKAFEPLLHVVRNAVGHGIEAPDDRVRAGKPTTGRVTLEAIREGNTLVLSVQDDGRGLNYEAIAAKARKLGLIGPDEAAGPERLGALIFVSGFSTRQEANAISGRGVGMDVVAQEVRRLRGTIDLTSQPGHGSRITLRLPARLALEQAMIARVAGQAVAIPVSLIEHAQPFEPGDVEGTGTGATVLVRDRRVPLIVAREVLGFSTTAPASCPKLLLVRAEGDAIALLFDAIDGTRELVIKPLGPLLAGHPVIWGTSLSLTGDVIFILNPSGLSRWLREGRGASVAVAEVDRAPRLAPVLVVDDSISVRRVVSRQLRKLGLDVEEVSNGIEALAKLSKRTYSMVLTDLEMHRMDGFELLAELRRSPALAALPVIVASTESRPATRRRALDLGAHAFVAKPIDQDELARVAGTLLNRAIG